MNITLPKTIKLNTKSFSQIHFLALTRRISKYLVGAILLGAIIGLGYVWYSAIYAYSWTEEQKEQYRNEYAGETSFREDRFNHTVDILKERIRLHQALPAVEKDIFTGNTL